MGDDHSAFERIVEEHAPAVYRIVAGHLGSGEAEDAAQEVFTRVYLGLPGFKGESAVATWIFRIATNVALTRAKRRKKRPRAGTLDDEPAEPRGGPEDDLATRERREAVRRAVEQLPEDQRAVVVLRSFQGLSFDEVAQVLGILRPTAESRMARAKERLKGLLGDVVRD
jgi:RNA polymerase sigma-70 factor (ECF subfamily)